MRIDWAAPNCPDIERKVGIDPLGGTDPLLPRVVWSASSWEEVRMPDLHASTYAEASIITVFVWTHHPISHGADQLFIDAVTLVEDTTQPPATVAPSSTPTRKPPTRTPSPAPPTDTPTAPPPSPTSTETPTVAPTDTPSPAPSATPTVTWTPSPSPQPPTPTPSPTPSPTPLSVARLAPTSAAQVQAAMPAPRPTGRRAASSSLFLYVALGALGGALVLGGVVLWLWLRGSPDAEGPE